MANEIYSIKYSWLAAASGGGMASKPGHFPDDEDRDGPRNVGLSSC